MKNNGVACGSIGCATYKNSAGEKVYLGWYSPYTGDNFFGVEVLRPGSCINKDDRYEKTYQSTQMRTSDPAGTSIKANGELTENFKTIEVRYKITDNPNFRK